MSKKSQDFIKGGTAFETTNGYIDTAQFHDIGDIILFKYNVPHEVTPVNPEKESIDWSLPTGKWSVVLELRDTHNLSHQK
ncbi:MAG: hypothetical protein HKP31_01540 [Nitrosopumilus sp.]|nr:hypothetical protein [Nitrosopumilus sp.]